MRYTDEATERTIEWRRVTRQLEALYGVVRAGDDSTYTRQRIRRREALCAALPGAPEALAA